MKYRLERHSHGVLIIIDPSASVSAAAAATAVASVIRHGVKSPFQFSPPFSPATESH